MEDVTTWELALGLTALLLAIWPQMLDNSFKRIDKVESDYNKFVAGTSMVTGLSLLAVILIFIGVTTWFEGGTSKILLSIIIATLLITIPSFVTFYSRVMSYGKKVSRVEGWSVVIVEFLIGIAIGWLMITAG